MLSTILDRVSPSRRARNGALSAMLESDVPGEAAGPRVLLYHADADDRELAVEDVDLDALDERGLLWIDVGDLDQVEQATAILGLPPGTGTMIAQTATRADVVFDTAYFHVSAIVANRTPLGYEPAALQIVAGDNWILTVHETPLGFLERFGERIRGDSQLGRLDAAALVAVFLHEHVTSYLQEIEPIEMELERLDFQIMAGRADDDAVLPQLLAIRRRLAHLRRLLAPHRELYGRLARPDFELLADSESQEAFESLDERTERALQALDTTREMIVSSFEIYTTWTAHEANKVMKLLTVASVTLLPPTLLTSIMGMNSLPPVLANPQAFAVTMCVMGLLVATVLTAARRRGWIGRSQAPPLGP
jgi:magnesium/cobalt transport protein CorA